MLRRENPFQELLPSEKARQETEAIESFGAGGEERWGMKNPTSCTGAKEGTRDSSPARGPGLAWPEKSQVLSSLVPICSLIHSGSR